MKTVKFNTVKMIKRMGTAMVYYAHELGRTEEELQKLVDCGLLEVKYSSYSGRNLYKKAI